MVRRCPPPRAVSRLAAALVFLAGLRVHAAAAPVVKNPFGPAPSGRNVIDLRETGANARPSVDPPYPPAPAFEELDAFAGPAPAPVPAPAVGLPLGFVQVTDMIVPRAAAEPGALLVPDPDRALADPGAPSSGKEACAFPDAVPAGVYEGDDRPGGELPRRHTIYLNFVGGVLYSGGENSAENMSNIARSGHMFPVYTGGETKAIAVAQAVAVDFEFVQARIVYLERPPKILPYTMVMIGGSYTDTTAGPSGGVAPLDCEDFGQRNVCYAFQNTAPAINQANVVSQEIGHTMGLGHTEGTDRIMGAGYAGAFGDLVFGDECTPTIQVQGQSAACVGVNKCHCGAPDLQHDRNTLRWTYASPGPDVTPPEVTITEPQNGATFESGAAVPVRLDVWDDFGGYGWKLVLSDLDSGEVLADQVDYDRQAAWDLVGLPDGRYEARAVIMDQADNTGEDVVTFQVGEPGVGPTSDGSTGGTDGTGTTGGTDTDGNASPSEDGCGCRAPVAPGGKAGFVLLALLGRRRRPARAGLGSSAG